MQLLQYFPSQKLTFNISKVGGAQSYNLRSWLCIKVNFNFVLTGGEGYVLAGGEGYGEVAYLTLLTTMVSSSSSSASSPNDNRLKFLQ